MRILHLIPSLGTGGAETQLYYLSQRMAARGHDIHIAYYLHDKAARFPQNVNLHFIDTCSNYDPRLLLQIIKLIKHIKPDLLHSWSVPMDVLGCLAGKICRTRWLLREPSSKKAYAGTNIKHRLREMLARYANCIIANSDSGCDYWRNQAPAGRLELIQNGLPLEEINSVQPDCSILSGTAWSPQKPLILCAGRLAADISGQKNVDQLLRALALIKDRDFFCVICGNGPHREKLQELSRKLSLTEKVLFTGSLQQLQVWQLMKAARIFVSLSAFEGHPNTVMEAMACGCPLILSDIEAHRRLLDNRGAIFVNPGNEKAVSAAILNNLIDMHQADLRAKHARRVADQFSISDMADKYEKLYTSVLNEN